MINKEINIIGDGCAALSLARLIRNLPNYKLNLYVGAKNNINKDHFWGFWKVKINEEAYNNANHVWAKWSINTDDTKHQYSACTRTISSYMKNVYKSTFEPITGLRRYSSWICLVFLCRFVSSIRHLAL